MLKIFLLSIFVLFNYEYNIYANHPQAAVDLEKIRLASTDIVQMSISHIVSYDSKIKEFDGLKSHLNSLTSEPANVSTEQETKRISDEIAKLRTKLCQDYRQDRELRASLDSYKSALEELSVLLNFIYMHQSSGCSLICEGQISLLNDNIPVRCLLQNNIEATNELLFSILQLLEEMKRTTPLCNQNLNPEKYALNMATIKSLIRRK